MLKTGLFNPNGYKPYLYLTGNIRTPNKLLNFQSATQISQISSCWVKLSLYAKSQLSKAIRTAVVSLNPSQAGVVGFGGDDPNISSSYFF